MPWKQHTQQARTLSLLRSPGELRLGRQSRTKLLNSVTSKIQEWLTLNHSESLQSRLPLFQKTRNSTLKLLRSSTLALSLFKLEKVLTGVPLRLLPSQLFFKKDITSVFQAKMLRGERSRTDTPTSSTKTRMATTIPSTLPN